MRTLDDAPFLDMLSPEILADPAPIVDELRRESWLARTALGAMVIDHQHVQCLLADRRLRGSFVEFAKILGLTDGPLKEFVFGTMLAMEGEDHDRIRRLVRKAFVPPAIDRHRPLMRALLDSLVAPLASRTSCEFMAEVAEHYPIQVMCHMLGVPAQDHEDFGAWSKAIAWVSSFELAAHRNEAELAMKHMDDYVGGLVAERRLNPRHDLVTELVQAEEAGDRLTNRELRSLIALLLFAGYDRTSIWTATTSRQEPS